MLQTAGEAINAFDPSMPIPEDNAIRQQLDYYRARSHEYDEWWLRQGRYDRGAAANERWFSDSADLLAALERFGPSGRILELACGTGIWSEKLLPFASELTLVDGSSEMLAAAERRLRSGNVHYIEANLFDWMPAAKFDTVFFSFWLSHVPPSRFDAFWTLVGNSLAPGGRVFFIDSRREESSTARDHELSDRADIQLQRRLNDGQEFRIYKIFYDTAALQQRLGELGWSFCVSATECYFLYGEGQRRAVLTNE